VYNRGFAEDAIAARGHVHGDLADDDKSTSRIEQLIVNGFITMRVSQNLDNEDQMLLTNSSEYKEGEAAFCCGLTVRNNPYPFCSPEYWRWQEGLLGNCQPRKRQVNPKSIRPLGNEMFKERCAASFLSKATV
jgi:hypothetical protein